MSIPTFRTMFIVQPTKIFANIIDTYEHRRVWPLRAGAASSLESEHCGLGIGQVANARFRWSLVVDRHLAI